MMAPEHKHGLQCRQLGTLFFSLQDCSPEPTYLWFVQQTHQEAKGPEVSDHILGIALHVLLIEYVDQSLRLTETES